MLYLILLSSLAFLIAFSVLIWGLRTYSQHKTRKTQALGLIWLSSLRMFLAKVQKHRGLSTGLLNGERSLENQILKLQASIADDINVIESAGEWMEKSERWVGIVEHWRRLSQKYKSYSAADNLNQHHWMIQNTLYLIEDMADEHALISLARRENIEYLWKDLLQTIEFMGQARAIGTGVAAVGSCGSVERIRLNYLLRKIKSNCEVLVENVPERTRTKETVDKLLNFINEHILGKQCDVDPQEYFGMVTESLEFLYAQYDTALARLKV